MKITKRQLRKIIREAMHNYPGELRDEQDDAAHYEQMDDPEFQHKMDAMIPINDFQEQIEWGEWPGRPPSFEWDYVEQEGSQDLRFDWRGGSMWYRAYSPPGTVEGNIPNHLIQHLEKMGLEVYAE